MFAAVQNLISFMVGAATVIGTYLAWRQIRLGERRIELLEAHCEPRVPNEWHDRGFPFSFRLFLMNRGPNESALTAIEIRICGWRLRRLINHKPRTTMQKKWMELTFEDVLHQLGGRYKPLVFKPYEYKEMYGFWWDPIGRPENIKDNVRLREIQQEAHLQLMRRNIKYRLIYADGKTKRFRFRR